MRSGFSYSAIRKYWTLKESGLRSHKHVKEKEHSNMQATTRTNQHLSSDRN